MDGLVTLKSTHDFATTLSRLTAAIMAKGATIFAIVDHADGAALADLDLQPTTLVIFGNPAAGTPLMQENRRAGIDLPLKALIWQDESGVFLTYNDPAWIAERHNLNRDGMADLATALKAFGQQATA
jgi:uncharacterized protein (DUF302 family)